MTTDNPKKLIEEKRQELETLFGSQHDQKQVEEVANILWGFAKEKFGREYQGVMFLAFLNCADRSMFHIIGTAQVNSHNILEAIKKRQ